MDTKMRKHKSHKSTNSFSDSDERQKCHSHRDRSVSKNRKISHSSHKEKDSHSMSKHKSKKRKKSKDSDQDNEEELLKKLEKNRKAQKENEKIKKQFMKSKETLGEKRLRRLLKKEAKERKRKEAMGWDKEYLHFTNEDNPYGDNDLLTPFTWKKKLEKEGLGNLSKEEVHKLNRKKMEENRDELVKVKKRRQEREKERGEREKIMELEQRQKEAAQFSAFSKQEDVFQLEQARIRSQIRIQNERAKPIDLLAQYVNSEGDVTAVDMHEAYTHLTGLTLHDLEDLIEDIKVYKQLDKENKNQTYWNDLTTIVLDELRRLRHRESGDTTNQRQGIHASVADSISQLFQNKSVSELNHLRKQIENKLAGPTVGIDVGYWESLLSQLKAHKATANLRERHRENLKKKLEMLKAEQGVQIAEDSPAVNDSKSRSSQSDSEGDDESDIEISINVSINSYSCGRFSPKLFSQSELEPGTVVVDEMEDNQRLLWARQKHKGQKVQSSLTPEEKLMQREAQKAMSSDEVQFSVEAKIDSNHYLWSDKYRPRKPRYFNRVHTGFEWNKYNQTHYDMDNPPPKIVQGYKFNIFYPDLIDKNKTPQYELIPCDENKDFALLKFTAGPPYEDIAFKIVSREWEYSYKRGFRCQFHNNIFQLWFHFKRYRYRR